MQHLLENPDAIFAAGVEDAVTDPLNPHVAAAHLFRDRNSALPRLPGGILTGE